MVRLSLTGMSIAILLLASNIAVSQETNPYTSRGIEKKPKTRSVKTSTKKKKRKPAGIPSIRLNTLKDFRHVKTQDTYVFMIGNDKYLKKSDFSPLKQCYNDVKLLKEIFIKCSGIPAKNIMAHQDLTRKTFMKNFKWFINSLKKDSLVIITYSGHGDSDGSLVFVDGSKIMPDELKSLVNSFPNDTVLFIDACYSGNNEGPKDFTSYKKKTAFKSNSIRVYASLAHLSAKEIIYKKHPFFKPVLAFYRDVLGLHDLKGNGYFTALIGYFFAEYNFKKNENISFIKLISYVTNKGNAYVETLAKEKHYKLAGMRLNQQPKVLPITERVNFQDRHHNFLFIQNYDYPLGLDVQVFGGVFMPLGFLGGFYQDYSMTATVYFNYELSFILKNLFANLSLTYLNLNSLEDPSRRNVSLNILIPTIGIKYHPFRTSLFSFSLGGNIGSAVTSASYGSMGPIKEESRWFYNLAYDAHFALHVEVYDNFTVMIPARYIYINYADNSLHGLSLGLGATHYF